MPLWMILFLKGNAHSAEKSTTLIIPNARTAALITAEDKFCDCGGQPNPL